MNKTVFCSVSHLRILRRFFQKSGHKCLTNFEGLYKYHNFECLENYAENTQFSILEVFFTTFFLFITSLNIIQTNSCYV
jgi:hypothetical protein